MKTKRQQPNYYKLVRVRRTIELTETMILIKPDLDVKDLTNNLVNVINRYELTKGFYKRKNLLKD